MTSISEYVLLPWYKLYIVLGKQSNSSIKYKIFRYDSLHDDEFLDTCSLNSIPIYVLQTLGLNEIIIYKSNKVKTIYFIKFDVHVAYN